MKVILEKVKASFRMSMSGEEALQVLIWKWGVFGYLVAYFIANRLVKSSNIYLVDLLISLPTIVYFSWHIYVLRKCSPKKPKLSKEEKEKLRIEMRKGLIKSFLRKFFLQEPLTKWDPVFVTIVVDVLCIVTFLGYVFK